MQDRKIRSDQWSPEDTIIQEIIQQYNGGMSARKLGFKYKVADVTITSLLNRNCVFIRNRSNAQRTNQIIENAFDIITEESAYWIGFLLADGNIYHPKKRSKQLNIGLADRDWEHLEKFKKFIGSNKPLYYNKDGVFLSIYSNRIVEKLAEYGIIPKKSKIAKVPDILKNDRHFWRGMIDGDGWVTLAKTGYPIVGLCGTIEVITNFMNFVGKRVVILLKGDNFGQLKYDCTSAKILVKKLYDNATIFLRRKHNKYQQICLWTPKIVQNRSLLCIR
jgi:hypothetical protein